MIRVLLSSFLLTVQLTALAGACPAGPQRFLNGRYAPPKGVTAECGPIWKQWRYDSTQIHEEHFAWLEMWSVNMARNRDDTPTKIKDLILKAGYAFDPKKKDAWERIYGGITYYFTRGSREQLTVQLFGIGDFLYVVIGSR